MGEDQAKRDEGGGSRWFGTSSVFHEYPVDILGALVPGILLVVGTAVALLPPVLDLYRRMPGAQSSEPVVVLADQLRQAASWSSTAVFFLCTGIALMTYVAGHVFYRRDPKLPDQASFRLLERGKVVELALRRASGPISRWPLVKTLRRLCWHLRVRWAQDPRRVLEEDDEALVALDTYLTQDLGSPNAERCEFPYPNFLDYLTKRGLDYLSPLVGWRQENRDTRSKLWVNVLKVRLMMHHPHKCRQIIRNEAHIRLASGTWYVAGALRVMAGAGVALTAALVLWQARGAWTYGHRIDWPRLAHVIGGHFWALLLPLSVLTVAWYLRRKIDGFYHYQRMREVDWVLETAFTAFRDQRETLNPPFYR